MAFSPSTPNPAIDSGDLNDFLADLARQEAARKTVVNDRSDLLGFARWLKDTTTITPTSVGHTARFVLDHAPCNVLLLRDPI